MNGYIGNIDQRMTTTILHIIQSHTVKDPISRGDLVQGVNRYGFETSERTVREAIKLLRRCGQIICSAPGVNGGYYIARDRDEYEDFKRRELMAKVNDMLETVRSMDQAAEREFNTADQMQLF